MCDLSFTMYSIFCFKAKSKTLLMEKNYFLYFNALLDGNRKNGFGGFPLLNLKPLTDWETPSDSISYLKIKSL